MTLGMSGRTPRWQRVAGTVVSTVLLTGCSAHSEGTRPAAASSTSARTATSTPSPDVQKAGRALLDRAITATSALRSYSFDSTTTFVVGARTSTVRLIGRTVLPDSLAYALTVGARRSEVVVLPAAIFRRSPGQAWHKAAAGARSASPLDALLGVLKALTPTTVIGGHSVTGTLTTNQAHTLGILNANVISALTTVVVDVDTAGHITGFRLTSRGSRSGASVRVEQRARFGSFDHAVAIAAPR